MSAPIMAALAVAHIPMYQPFDERAKVFSDLGKDISMRIIPASRQARRSAAAIPRIPPAMLQPRQGLRRSG
jgi:hypothetical protein